MALFSIDGKEQKNIGIKEHWGLFRTFQGTPLHAFLKQEIEKQLKTEAAINSKQLGSQILSKSGEVILALETKISDEQLRSLYGMVLWNTIAERDENWHFCKQEKSCPEATSAVLYFRDRN